MKQKQLPGRAICPRCDGKGFIAVYSIVAEQSTAPGLLSCLTFVLSLALFIGGILVIIPVSSREISIWYYSYLYSSNPYQAELFLKRWENIFSYVGAILLFFGTVGLYFLYNKYRRKVRR